jgi:hypothetical protein
MARRRHFIARPLEHLSAAADVHARLTRGELAGQDGVEEADDGPSKTEGRRKRDQARESSTGRFK